MSPKTTEPSETSPLLPERVVKPSAIEPADVPQGGPIIASANQTDGGEAGGDDEPDAAREAQFKGNEESRKRLKYIVPALSIGIYLAAVDQTIVAASYAKIGSELNALNNTSWIASAYFLSLTSFQPLYGKLSDIFGRKSALLFAYAVFGLGSLWCGVARSMPEFIAARAFAGIGGAGMTTVVSIIMSDIVPLRERGTWQGIINIIFATGASTGAPIGGWLADSEIGWRWAFGGQAPICVLAFVVCFFALKLPKIDSGDWKSKMRRIDAFGAVFLIIAVSLLLVGLDFGSNKSWTNNVTIITLVLCIPAFGAFFVTELKYAVEPIAPGRIIFDRALVAAYLCNFFSLAGWYAIVFYLPLYFQAVRQTSAAESGLRLVPAVAGSVTGSLGGGIIMQKTGKYYTMTIIAYILLAIASVPMVLFTGPLGYNGWIVGIATALGGFGNGIGITTTLIAIIANAAPQDQAVATACSYLFRSLGAVLGLAITASTQQVVLRQKLEEKLGEGDLAKELAQKVRESLDFLKTLDPETQVSVRQAYGDAITAVLVVMTGIVVFAVISACFIRETKLNR